MAGRYKVGCNNSRNRNRDNNFVVVERNSFGKNVNRELRKE